MRGPAFPHLAALMWATVATRSSFARLSPPTIALRYRPILTIDAVAAVRSGSATMYASLASKAALLALCGLLGSSCRETALAEAAGSWPTKAWETSVPEQQGMDSGALAA